jgi:hypothetical protein
LTVWRCELLPLQVRFSGDQGSITAMLSAEGEVVDLAAPVKVRRQHFHMAAQQNAAAAAASAAYHCVMHAMGDCQLS